jgi:hypothetical protein
MSDGGAFLLNDTAAGDGGVGDDAGYSDLPMPSFGGFGGVKLMLIDDDDNESPEISFASSVAARADAQKLFAAVRPAAGDTTIAAAALAEAAATAVAEAAAATSAAASAPSAATAAAAALATANATAKVAAAEKSLIAAAAMSPVSAAEARAAANANATAAAAAVSAPSSTPLVSTAAAAPMATATKVPTMGGGDAAAARKSTNDKKLRSALKASTQSKNGSGNGKNESGKSKKNAAAEAAWTTVSEPAIARKAELDPMRPKTVGDKSLFDCLVDADVNADNLSSEETESSNGNESTEYGDTRRRTAGGVKSSASSRQDGRRSRRKITNKARLQRDLIRCIHSLSSPRALLLLFLVCLSLLVSLRAANAYWRAPPQAILSRPSASQPRVSTPATPKRRLPPHKSKRAKASTTAAAGDATATGKVARKKGTSDGDNNDDGNNSGVGEKKERIREKVRRRVKENVKARMRKEKRVNVDE